MNLDPRTIVVINFISALIMGIGLLNVSRGYLAQIRLVKKWAYATLLHSFGWALIGFRGFIHPVFSIVAANIILMVSLAVYFNILAELKGIKIKRYLIFLPLILFAVFITYYTFVIQHFGNRIIASSICSVYLLYSSAYILLIKNKRRNNTDIFSGLVFIICGSIMLVRSITFIDAPAKIQDYLLEKSIIHDIMFLTYYLTSVMLTFGFILMCNDLYITERKQAEDELKHSKEILEETNQIARIGSWEIDLSNDKLYWSSVTKEIHEVADDYVPDIQSAINFYKEGINRTTITEVVNNAKEKASSFDINLEIITQNGNERWVRAIGKSEFLNKKCVRIYGIFQDITENTLNSKIIKQNELILQEAQKIAKVGNYSYDFKKGIWNCSKTIDKISGLSSEESKVFENWKKIIAPEFKEQFLEKLYETISYGKRIPKNNHDIKIIRPHDFEERWVSINGEMEYDNFGNPSILFGTVQDITERKIVEQKLQQSEERYRQIVETAQEGIWLLDKNNITIFVNKKMCEILEYTADEIIGKKSIEFMSDEGKIISSKALERRKKGVKEKFETCLLTKNGKKIWASFSANPILDEHNNYQGSLAMVTDITENLLANELIKKSEEKYRSLFNNNPITIFIWDLDTYKIIEVNDAATKEYGYNREEFSKMTILDLRTKDEHKNVIQFANEIRDMENTRISKIWKHRSKSGEQMSMNISSFRIIYNNKPAVLAMAENVTEKIMVEKRLQNSYDEIRMLTNHLQSIREEERTHIAREIHDELGQQLTVLKMDVLSLKNRADIMSPIAQSKTDHMIQMIERSMRTVKKISSELRPSILDDLGLIAALEWQAKEFQQRTDIICDFKTSCDTDNFSDKINTAVFRIFQESLTNVARHAKASKINTKLYMEDDMLILSVSDNGVGICSTRKNNKTSFGLLGMKERATMLNGDILISKIPDGGTCVTLKIPVLC